MAGVMFSTLRATRSALGGRFFRADAAYAIPAIYERLEEARFFYAIRLPANAVLKDKIAHRLTRPVGRPSLTKVKRFFEEFEYQAASWDKERRVIAKIEWHPGELFPRVGFIVTNLPMDRFAPARHASAHSAAPRQSLPERCGSRLARRIDPCNALHVHLRLVGGCDLVLR
jgi:hypothetical protein